MIDHFLILTLGSSNVLQSLDPFHPQFQDVLQTCRLFPLALLLSFLVWLSTSAATCVRLPLLSMRTFTFLRVLVNVVSVLFRFSFSYSAILWRYNNVSESTWTMETFTEKISEQLEISGTVKTFTANRLHMYRRVLMDFTECIKGNECDMRTFVSGFYS